MLTPITGRLRLWADAHDRKTLKTAAPVPFWAEPYGPPALTGKAGGPFHGLDCMMMEILELSHLGFCKLQNFSIKHNALIIIALCGIYKCKFIDSLFSRIMRKCNFKTAMGWRLSLQPVLEWAESYGSHGHGPAPLAACCTTKGQCTRASGPCPIVGCHFGHGPTTKLG
jgi:hypothetical protein